MIAINKIDHLITQIADELRNFTEEEKELLIKRISFDVRVIELIDEDADSEAFVRQFINFFNDKQ